MTTTIVYVIGQMGVGGTEHQLVELIKYLDKQRFRPVVYVLNSGSSRVIRQLEEMGSNVITLDREHKSRSTVMIDLFSKISALRPDIIQAFGYASRASFPVGKVLRIPCILGYRTYPHWNSRITLYRDRFFYRMAKATICNSRSAACELVEKGVVHPSRCHVVYNGISTTAFDNMSRTLNDYPANASLKKDMSVIVSVCGLRPVKHLDLLLVAFQKLLGVKPNAQLWLVGDGLERNKLEALTRELNIQDSVVFWGNRTDIPAILQHADIGVLSSGREGIANAIIEYMCAGLPVVATDLPGNRELVSPNKTGLLFPLNDHDALARNLMYLISRPQLRYSMGVNGREFVEKMFQMDRMVHETTNIYENIITD